ncbi:MAG: DUF5777 family beta-barrel protein [Acidobacteriota bacterium]
MPQLARWILVFSCVAFLGIRSTEASQAQSGSSTTTEQAQAAPPPAPAQQPTEDDERQLRLVEPDFVVTNLPTTLILPKHTLNFRLTHRFLLNLQANSFTDNLENLFGLDNGAIVGLEVRFAPIRHLQAIVYRNNLSKTIQFAGQYEWLRQGSSLPFSLSGIVSIEGTNNFKGSDEAVTGDDHQHDTTEGHYSPAFGAVVSRTFSDRLATYAVPVWVHRVVPLNTVGHEDVFYLGVGGRYRISAHVYVVGEVSPRFSGNMPGDPAYAFGIERRAGGHMFQLNFGNSLGSTYGQIAQGGFPDTIYLGFNLARKFF